MISGAQGGGEEEDPDEIVPWALFFVIEDDTMEISRVEGSPFPSLPGSIFTARAREGRGRNRIDNDTRAASLG